MMTRDELERVQEQTWRDAERVFRECLLYMADRHEGSGASASDALREMAQMFEEWPASHSDGDLSVVYSTTTLQ